MNKCCKLFPRDILEECHLTVVSLHGVYKWTRRASSGFERQWGAGGAGKSGYRENRAINWDVCWMMTIITLSSMAHKVFSKTYSAWQCFGDCMFLTGEMKYRDWLQLGNTHGYPVTSECRNVEENLMVWKDVHNILLRKIIGCRKECAIAILFWLK